MSTSRFWIVVIRMASKSESSGFDLAAFVAKSAEQSGVPVHVDDPSVLHEIAGMLDVQPMQTLRDAS